MAKYLRIGLLLLSLVAVGLCVAFNCPALIEWVSVLSAFAMAGICAWENNDFTFAAKMGTQITEAIKDGKLTVGEIKQILEGVNRGDKPDA